MSAFPCFPRRFLSLWLPFLPTDRILRRHDPRPLEPGGSSRRAPFVLVAKAEGTDRIMAVDPIARARGIEIGMSLAQARAMQPMLSSQPHDAAADATLLERIADWADRYTPLVGRHPPDGLILDITGAAHLVGGEAALAADVSARLARQGLAAAVAIAPTVGAAWALAHFGRAAPAAAHKGPAILLPTILLPETIDRAGLDAALADLPVAALRIDPGTASALRRVGLARIGHLIGRPRAALAARFGASLILGLDRARGIDTEAISPRQPIAPALVEEAFAEPILTTDAVAMAAGRLADRLASLLEDRGLGATAVELSVWRVDGLVKRIGLGLAAPCRDPTTLTSLIRLRLGHLADPLDPGFGYDLVRLAATATAALGAEARPLTGLDAEVPPLSLAEACAPLIDRLAARFGAAAVHTLAAADTHIPERASRLERATVRSRPAIPPAHRDAADPLALRPIRLFDPPEPVDVVAEVPDGPPAQVNWRRKPVRVVAAHGPERIAPEWWRLAVSTGALRASSHRSDDGDLLCATTRDYWRIEDAIGRRLWLYSEGVFGGPPEAPVRPRWYVHGLFT